MNTSDIPQFMDALLALFPHGVNASLLLDALAERGIDRDEASASVRRGLDGGTLALGHRLQIVRVAL
jgi:hypothetical protein